MSNYSNTRLIVFASLMGAILAIGLLALNPSPTITNAGAQMYGYQYGYDNSYKNHYQDPRNSQVEIQKISCLNDNTNINGIDITEIPEDNTAALAAVNQEGSDGANTQNGNGFADEINFNKNLVNICVNVNVNEQVKISPPVEPQTASLTVNKKVFGCNNISFPEGAVMDCEELENGQDAPDFPLGWLPCTDLDEFSETNEPRFCQKLTENLFDIKVSDDQNIPIIDPFEGSALGTTIPNLQPGTYIVNEIKDPAPGFPANVLRVDADIEEACVDNGFSDGGDMFNNLNVPPDPTIPYNICFEYEDEEGNDCSTVTLAAGENKVCTVKNYIFSAST